MRTWDCKVKVRIQHAFYNFSKWMLSAIQLEFSECMNIHVYTCFICSILKKTMTF